MNKILSLNNNNVITKESQGSKIIKLNSYTKNNNLTKTELRKLSQEDLRKIKSAIIQKKYESIEDIIENNPNLKKFSSCNEGNAIVCAASLDYRATKLLVDKYDFNVNFIDKKKQSPLMHASKNNHTNIVKYLISKGAKINHQDKFKYTSLMIASEQQNYQIMESLIKNKADSDYKDYTGKNALMLLCKKNNVDKDCLELLVDNTPNINEVDNSGNSALIYLSNKNQENFQKELIKYLISKGADLDQTNKKGENAKVHIYFNDPEWYSELIKGNNKHFKYK